MINSRIMWAGFNNQVLGNLVTLMNLLVEVLVDLPWLCLIVLRCLYTKSYDKHTMPI